MAGRFDYLRKLLPFVESSPAQIAERRAIQEADAANKAIQLAEQSSPEVLGFGTSKAKTIDLPIEDADTLSPKLNGIDLPKNADQERLAKLKAAMAALGAGGAGALAVNLGNPTGEPPKVPPVEMNRSPAADLPLQPSLPPPSAASEISESEKNVIRALGSAPSRASELKNIDFGTENSIASKEAFADAMRRRNEGQLGVGLGQIGAAAAATMSGSKNNFEQIGADQQKSVQGIPDDYLKKVAFEKEDPKSPMSKGYRDLAKTMGFNVKGEASAADLEKLVPQLANIYNQEQARSARREDNLAKLAALKDARKEKEDAKTSLKKDKDVENFRKELDSGNLQKIKQSYNTAHRMSAAIDQFSKNPTGYSDYGTLMGGLKVLQGDESVVREAEIRLGMNAGSLGDKIKNQVSSVVSGKSLQPKQRQDIINTVKVLSDISKQRYLQEIEPIIVSANKRNLPLNELVNEDILSELQKKQAAQGAQSQQPDRSPAVQPGKTVIKKGYNAQTNQTQLIYSDGTKEVVDGRR